MNVTTGRGNTASSLSAGIHFWRAFARRGESTEPTPSPVWEFEVLDATRPLAPTRPIIDLNGDGVRDTVTVGAFPFREYGVGVRYGVSPDGARRADDSLRGPMSALENPLEIFAGDAAGMGDLDGDGLADALLWMFHRVRQSEFQSYQVLRLMALYGNRVGAPRLGGPLNFSTGSNPGPYLASGLALGNALGLSGYLAAVGNSPICRSMVEFASSMSELPSYLTCDGGTLTAGDYDADGRVEAVEMWPPYTVGTTKRVPLCARVPWLGDSGVRPQSLTRDLDLDGYDDLVLWRDETSSYTVYGGPRGLDGSRCSAMP